MLSSSTRTWRSDEINSESEHRLTSQSHQDDWRMRSRLQYLMRSRRAGPCNALSRGLIIPAQLLLPHYWLVFPAFPAVGHVCSRRGRRLVEPSVRKRAYPNVRLRRRNEWLRVHADWHLHQSAIVRVNHHTIIVSADAQSLTALWVRKTFMCQSPA